MDIDLLVLPRWSCSIGQDILRALKSWSDDCFPKDDNPCRHIILPQGTREIPQSVRVHFVPSLSYHHLLTKYGCALSVDCCEPKLGSYLSLNTKPAATLRRTRSQICSWETSGGCLICLGLRRVSFLGALAINRGDWNAPRFLTRTLLGMDFLGLPSPESQTAAQTN